MALDQNIKDTVIADVEYFNHKHKKGEKIGVEGGMSRKLEALKRELQAVNPPQSEDKELARKWVASFPLDDLEGDDTAKGKIRILKEEVGKGKASIVTVDAGAKPPPEYSPNGSPSRSRMTNRASSLIDGESFVNGSEEKLRSTIEGEVDPDELESFANESLKLIDAISDPEMKRHASEFHASILIGLLRSSGYNIVLKNGRVELIPKPGVDAVNLSKKFQTLVDTRKISMQTLSIALLYNSPAFRDYAKMVQTGSGKEGEIIINPNANLSDFTEYLRARKNVGDKYSDTYSLISSESVLKGVSIPSAIKGLDYWDRAGVKLGEDNALTKKAQEALAKAESTLQGSIPTTSPGLTPPVQPNQSPQINVAPAEPNTRMTGFLADKTAGGTGGIVSESAKLSINGLTGAIGDIMSIGNGDPLLKVGIVGALIYGAYQLYKKAGFFKGLGLLLGMGFINNFDAISKSWGGTKFGKKIETAVDTATKASKDVAEQAAAQAKKAAGAAGGAAEGTLKSPEKVLELTRTQDEATRKVGADERIKAKVDSMKVKSKNATLEMYLKFINTECKDKKMEVFLSRSKTDDAKIANGNISVFANSRTLHPSITLPNNLDPVIFKDIMRLYISGLSIPTQELDGVNNRNHADAISAFQKKAWTPDDTLIDALPKIYIKP